MKNKIFVMTLLSSLLFGCNKQATQTDMPNITAETTKNVISELTTKYPDNPAWKISKGVEQLASLWNNSDGDENTFKKFCTENYVGNPAEQDVVFEKVLKYMETLQGNFHKLDVELKEAMHMDLGQMHPIDLMYGSYNAASHVTTDLFNNKIAFYVALNFPAYSLKEKMDLGSDWSRKQWAQARIGDLYTSRIPANLIQKASEVITLADDYIANYNIYMGKLVDSTGKTYFPSDMKLITHWGLRDELKSNYADKENGLLKQKMIYGVMKNIISQQIPLEVINQEKWNWDPLKNKLSENGKEITGTPEPNTRYQFLLENFNALKQMDPYSPKYPSFIERAFDESLELTQAEVEELFIGLVSAPQVKEVGKLISNRLGRPLEPFDIWYNGFRVDNNGIPEAELDKILNNKYPDRVAFEKDLPNILAKLGFEKEKANFIASLIQVDPSRGAGHAWGAEMHSDKSRLRTRIGKSGMDYKGYNIAIHEFGHNVEQTITLQDMDYYSLHSVPNTAFTEAMAFIFQKRDRKLLGISNGSNNTMHLMALDNFWSCYEIMGVSLVDMNVWKWLYANPNSTASQLNEAITKIAVEVWNKYYADVFGIKDQTILAIYSHMIDNPLYLSAYPIGHLIDFQIEQYIEGKNLAKEISRMLVQGRVIPQVWMMGAVGNKISTQPILDATSLALKHVQ